MKLYLDDVRDPPDASWTLSRSSNGFLWALKTNWDAVEAISLDHDLGLEQQTGYDVLCEIERWTEGKIPHFTISVHSDNSAGILKMNNCIRRMIERSLEEAGI